MFQLWLRFSEFFDGFLHHGHQIGRYDDPPADSGHTPIGG
jgi:hypothetical protein